MRLRIVFELINDTRKTLLLATSSIKKRQLVGITKSSSHSFYSCEIFQMTDNFSRRRSVRRFHAPKEEYSSRFFNVMFSVTPSFTIRQRIVINEPRKTRHRVLAFLFLKLRVNNTTNDQVIRLRFLTFCLHRYVKLPLPTITRYRER